VTQLALITELEQAGAITPTSLTLRDPNMDFDQFEAICRMMGQLRSSNSWWIGDLIVFGEGAYGERYPQAQEAFGLAYHTLTGYAYVSRNVARRRRRATLTFGHHKLVAPKEPAVQSKWLARAAEAGWTCEEMREAMRSIEPGGDNGSESETDGSGPTVKDAARRVWIAAQRDGDRYIVPAEPMQILASTLGLGA